LDCENSLSCWNSEGSPNGKTSSFLVIDFGRTVRPIEIALQFQAGFVAEELKVFRRTQGTTASAAKEEEWAELADFEVDDDHEVQSFPLADQTALNVQEAMQTNALKLVFDECTDFYGRVTIYKLQVWGQELG